VRVTLGPPGRLSVEDQLGRRRRYWAVDPDPEVVPVLPVGSYHAPELGDLVVELADGSVQIVIDRRRFRLERVASFAGDDIYRASGDQPLWVRRHVEDGSLTVGTGNTVFRCAPDPSLPAGVG
jgi:hypothetical protein